MMNESDLHECRSVVQSVSGQERGFTQRHFFGRAEYYSAIALVGFPVIRVIQCWAVPFDVWGTGDVYRHRSWNDVRNPPNEGFLGKNNGIISG